jgi:hypothetical protein
MTFLPNLKLKALVTFPANVVNGAGIHVYKQNGVYQFNLAFGDFAPPVATLTDPNHQDALLWNDLTGQYTLVPVSVLLGGASGAAGGMPQGRLTLSSTVPTPAADFAGAIAINYLPAGGSLVPIYDGSKMVSRSIGAGLTLPLDPTAAHFGYHVAGSNFDLFAMSDGGTTRLVSATNWAFGAAASPNPDKFRATGANSSELVFLNGVLVNKNVLTARYGASAGQNIVLGANQGTYVGSFRASADGQASDTRTKRLLYNAYNQAPRSLYRVETGVGQVYSAAVYDMLFASTANRLEVLLGLDGSIVDLLYQAHVCNIDATPQGCLIALGVDQVSATVFAYQPAVVNFETGSVRYCDAPGIGYSQFNMLWRGSGAGTQTWAQGCNARGQVVM